MAAEDQEVIPKTHISADSNLKTIFSKVLSLKYTSYLSCSHLFMFMHYLLFVTWIWDVQRWLRVVNSTPRVCKKNHLVKMAGIRSKLMKIKEKHEITRHF